MASIFPATLGNISYFTTIYTIIALVVIYPYFANEKKYYTLVIIFGALFDILYTSTLLLNVVFFLLIALVIKILNTNMSDNIFTINVISIISIILYHLLSFIILNLETSQTYSLILLGNIITHSILMTIVYTSISYVIIKLIYKALTAIIFSRVAQLVRALSKRKRSTVRIRIPERKDSAQQKNIQKEKFKYEICSRR